jgi:rubrerythrin
VLERHCNTCNRDLPSSAFAPSQRVCRECSARVRRAYRLRMRTDPDYQPRPKRESAASLAIVAEAERRHAEIEAEIRASVATIPAPVGNRCPRCSTSLHRERADLDCHMCGYRWSLSFSPL